MTDERIGAVPPGSRGAGRLGLRPDLLVLLLDSTRAPDPPYGPYGRQERLGVREAVGTAWLDGPQQYVGEGTAQVAQATDPARVQRLLVSGRLRTSRPWICSGERDVGGDPEGVQVEVGEFRPGGALPGDGVRGLVARRARMGVSGVDGHRRVEVQQLRAVGGPQQVAGLDVAVVDAVAVQMVEPGQTVLQQPHHVGGAQSALTGGRGLKVLPLHELQPQIGESALGQPVASMTRTRFGCAGNRRRIPYSPFNRTPTDSGSLVMIFRTSSVSSRVLNTW